jgi:hypothetical protein
MPARFGHIVVGDELEPLLTRARQYAEICYLRALRAASGARNAPPLDPKSTEGAIATYLQTRLRVGQGGAVPPQIRSPLSSALLRAERISNELQQRPQNYGLLARADINGQRSLGQQFNKNIFSDLVTKDSPIIKSLLADQAKKLRTPNLRVNQLGALSRRFILGKVRPDLALAEPAEGTQPQPKKHTQLKLELVRVKCMDEVDAEITDFGKDRINMGGKAYDSAGNEINVNQFHVSDFDQGDSFNFGNSPRTFAQFDLTRAGPWPRLFFGTFAMAEKDADGGFLNFLQQVWEAIDTEVINALTQAIMAGLAAAGVGAAAGAVLGLEAAGVGAIVGAIVGALVGFIVGLVMNSLNDDVFEPSDVAPLYLESDTAVFDDGGVSSDNYTTDLTRDGARYKVTYRWTLAPA